MRGQPGRTGGFTLIEMMVVIAVLGLVLSTLAQFGPWRSRWLQAKGAAGMVAAAMNADRGRAIATDAPVRLVLPRPPEGVTMTMSARPGGLVFEPDGSATGGGVIVGDGSRRIAVMADWLTGRVRVDAR